MASTGGSEERAGGRTHRTDTPGDEHGSETEPLDDSHPGGQQHELR
jgi:hypothetical protein